VQSSEEIVKRCILMTTDPGDLVLDPTCGSGTAAFVAEQWGRRWITIDTSRVALALARARMMGARYPYYLLADSAQGRAKEQQITGRVQPDTPTHGDVRQGFVYERATWNTSGSIANNAEIDMIWETWQETLEPLRAALNEALGRGTPGSPPFVPAQAGTQGARELDSRLRGNERSEDAASSDPPRHGEGKAPWEEWEIPREVGEDWPAAARDAHAKWWEARIARQKEIDASIARAADVELLYDRPYPDNNRVRVAGPFTVESLSPHRIVTALDDTLADETAAYEGRLQRGPKNMPEVDFGEMVLEHLRTAGVHQQAKADTIHFSAIEPWPGKWIAADGRYTDAEGEERRAAILIGPEFGTLSRSDITAGAREAAEARFDALIACAFNFDAQASDLTRLGPLAILKARMNPDLHMAEDLKNTGKGNLFVVFGEPDVDLIETGDGMLQVKVNGIDVFDPSTGEIRSDDAAGIAAWFIDTDYDEESFFVRHAYFLGAGDPYKSLKTALKAEIDEDAWASLYSDTSRPFARPATGRIAVKVINHFGDEVLKVFGV
jgi:adenine-specific DNA-methyltransferase